MSNLKIFIPATTAVVSRTPDTGGAYIAEEFFTLIHGLYSFTVGETVIGSDSKASGIVVIADSGSTILGNVQGFFSVSEIIIGEESGTVTSISSINKALDGSVSGNYLIDLTDEIMTSTNTTLNTEIVQGGKYTILQFESTVGFANNNGFFILDLGYDNEERPVPYIKILNSTDVLMDSSYAFKFPHSVDASIEFVKSKDKISPAGDGSDRGSYLTDVAKARQSCIDLINRIKSAGIVAEIEVLYPSDIGLGNAGLSNSDKIKVWGD